MATGKQIKHYRLKLGWTLEQLEDFSGVATGSIHALEKRDSERSKFFQAIARAFGITVEQLSDVNQDYPVVQNQINPTPSAQLPELTFNSPDEAQKQPLLLVAHTSEAINFDDAVKVLADAISASPARGSDVLIGALTSLAKDPDKLMHRQVLATIINAPDQSSQKAA